MKKIEKQAVMDLIDEYDYGRSEPLREAINAIPTATPIDEVELLDTFNKMPCPAFKTEAELDAYILGFKDTLLIMFRQSKTVIK